MFTRDDEFRRGFTELRLALWHALDPRPALVPALAPGTTAPLTGPQSPHVHAILLYRVAADVKQPHRPLEIPAPGDRPADPVILRAGRARVESAACDSAHKLR